MGKKCARIEMHSLYTGSQTFELEIKVSFETSRSIMKTTHVISSSLAMALG